MSTRLRTLLLAGATAVLPLAVPASAAVEEPLPRFSDALCPGVMGLPVEQAEGVVYRIRENAQALGLRVADEGTCEANLVVAFVNDGQAYLEQLRDERRYLFSEMDRPEREAVLSQPGPARVFMRTRFRTRDGHWIGRRQNLTDIPQANMWMAHSKIYSPVRQDITSVTVLFDRAAANGLKLNQLADYATMRALTKVLPVPESAPGGSILTLFQGAEERPAGLTQSDRAFLTSLYEGIANLPASVRLADLEQSSGARATQ